MLRRAASYVRQHHIAFLALFLALGGGGAVAATLGNGQVRGFEKTASNSSGTVSGGAGKLGSLTLRFSSQREDDARACALSVRAGKRGQVNWNYGVKPSSSPQSFEVGGRNLNAGGSAQVVSANFDEGAPGISRRVVGQITWHAETTDQVVTSVFHVGAESGRCRFHGTLTAAG
jgi:hypothetical protein